jgi:hypothetical protein
MKARRFLFCTEIEKMNGYDKAIFILLQFLICILYGGAIFLFVLSASLIGGEQVAAIMTGVILLLSGIACNLIVVRMFLTVIDGKVICGK